MHDDIQVMKIFQKVKQITGVKATKFLKVHDV